MSARGTKRGLFFSRDAGSVRAMLPVACALAGRPGWAVEVFGLEGYSWPILQDGLTPAGLVPQPLDAAAFAADPAACLDALLTQTRPDVVVSGSSPAAGPPPETPEQHLILAARRRGVASVGILDFWGFYGERFHGRDGKLDLDLVPDLLCVLDRPCRDDLVALGVPAARMAVTHNPALDSFFREAATPSARHTELEKGFRHLIFASQPLAEHRDIRGWAWSQFELFDAVVRALPKRPPWRILVWPHPRERIDTWRKVCAKAAGPVQVCLGEDRSPVLLAQVDLLVTSHSTVAHQAALCDTPIISFRPFTWKRLLPMVERLGLARQAGSDDEMRNLLAGFDPARERARMREMRAPLQAEGVFYSDGAATERVCIAIQHLTGK